MADIGLTQEQIDAMLADGSSGGSPGALSARDAMAVADFERDTLSNFPSVINAMTGFDYHLESVEVSRANADDVAALASDEIILSLSFSLEGHQRAFLILDQSFVRQVAAALTGGEPADEASLTEAELNAALEVLSQANSSYLASLGRALSLEASATEAVKAIDNVSLVGLLEAGSLLASIMLGDSRGNAAHLLHVIPPRLATLILDSIRNAQSGPTIVTQPEELSTARSASFDPAVRGDHGSAQAAPPIGSGNVKDSATQFKPAVFAQLGAAANNTDTRNLDMLLDVPLQIAVELGKTQVPIRHILEYGQGSLITLDKLAGEPVDMLVNGRYFAKAEVVVIDENFGVRITSILSPADRLAQVK